jgi:hypothetical protein
MEECGCSWDVIWGRERNNCCCCIYHDAVEWTGGIRLVGSKPRGCSASTGGRIKRVAESFSLNISVHITLFKPKY